MRTCGCMRAHAAVRIDNHHPQLIVVPMGESERAPGWPTFSYARRWRAAGARCASAIPIALIVVTGKNNQSQVISETAYWGNPIKRTLIGDTECFLTACTYDGE